MAVLKALRRTPSALVRNPALFVPVLALMALQIPQLVLQSVSPLIGGLVSLAMSLVFVVVVPFFQGGLLGMADEALDGRTSLGTFVKDGKSNYVSIFVVYLVLMAVNFLLGMVAFFAAVGGVIAVGGGGLRSANVAVLAVLAVVGLLVVAAYVLVVFFVQFYGQAIVIDGLGAVDGVKRSLSVVRNNLVSTLGYSALGVVVGAVAGAVFGGASLFLSPQTASAFALPEPSIAVGVVVALVVVAGGTAFGAFFAVFSVSFYREVA